MWNRNNVAGLFSAVGVKTGPSPEPPELHLKFLVSYSIADANRVLWYEIYIFVNTWRNANDLYN